MFPDSIRSMVLDGVFPTGPDDAAFESRAAGFEDALVKLDTSCKLWLDCALNEIGLIAAIDEVGQILKDEGSIGNLDARAFNNAVGLLYGIPEAMWDVAEGLEAALSDRGSLLAEIGGVAPVGRLRATFGR